MLFLHFGSQIEVPIAKKSGAEIKTSGVIVVHNSIPYCFLSSFVSLSFTCTILYAC